MQGAAPLARAWSAALSAQCPPCPPLHTSSAGVGSTLLNTACFCLACSRLKNLAGGAGKAVVKAEEGEGGCRRTGALLSAACPLA